MKDPDVNTSSLRAMMLAMYRRLPFEQSESFLAILRALADGDAPLLFHCAAGKDRTGAMAALLLELLGVPRETIVADFVLTDRAFKRNRDRFLRYGRRDGVYAAVRSEARRVGKVCVSTWRIRGSQYH